MPQRPYPRLLKELAFFCRLLLSQKREMAQTSKSSVRGDRSKKTLEIRADIRKTGGVIADLRAEMGKRDGDIRPGEGSPTPVRRVERPSSPPPPAPPPPPTDTLGVVGGEAPLTAREEGKRRKVETPKQESGYTKPPPLHRFRPTPVPGFDPSRPRPYAQSTSEAHRRRSSHRQPKRKAHARASFPPIPIQGRPGK